MSKKKTDKIWGGYKRYTLTDGTRFIARDDSDAELYRQKVGDVKWDQLYQIQKMIWERFTML